MSIPGFAFDSTTQRRPPLAVVRENGKKTWPSWYANDVDHAKHFVRSNRKSTPRDYPLTLTYNVFKTTGNGDATGDPIASFTVAEAVAAGESA